MDSISRVLEGFRGISRVSVAIDHIIFTFCARFFDSLSQLIDVYHTVPEIIVQILKFFKGILRKFNFFLILHQILWNTKARI